MEYFFPIYEMESRKIPWFQTTNHYILVGGAPITTWSSDMDDSDPARCHGPGHGPVSPSPKTVDAVTGETDWQPQNHGDFIRDSKWGGKK